MGHLFIRNLPEDLKRRAKVQSALQETSMKAVIEKALEEYLKKAEKKGGG